MVKAKKSRKGEASRKGELTIKPSALEKKSDRLHWTEHSLDDFAHRISFDFVTQIDNELEKSKSSQAELAKHLGVTKGRVSQVLNNPSTISLRNAVRYARAINRKVALVLYDDFDPLNENGPVNSEIFSQCWEMAGRPVDFFQLSDSTAMSFKAAVTVSFSEVLPGEYFYGQITAIATGLVQSPLLSETQHGLTVQDTTGEHIWSPHILTIQTAMEVSSHA